MCPRLRSSHDRAVRPGNQVEARVPSRDLPGPSSTPSPLKSPTPPPRTRSMPRPSRWHSGRRPHLGAPTTGFRVSRCRWWCPARNGRRTHRHALAAGATTLKPSRRGSGATAASSAPRTGRSGRSRRRPRRTPGAATRRSTTSCSCWESPTLPRAAVLRRPTSGRGEEFWPQVRRVRRYVESRPRAGVYGRRALAKDAGVSGRHGIAPHRICSDAGPSPTRTGSVGGATSLKRWLIPPRLKLAAARPSRRDADIRPSGDRPVTDRQVHFVISSAAQCRFSGSILNRLTTALRLFVAIPILVLLESVSVGTSHRRRAATSSSTRGRDALPRPLLMILFRQKYPRWWFGLESRAATVTNRVRRLPRAHGRTAIPPRRAAVSPSRLEYPLTRP